LRSIALDGGNVYVAGYDYDALGFETSLLIAHLRPGIPLWTNRFRLANLEAEAVSAAVTSNGKVIVAGT